MGSILRNHHLRLCGTEPARYRRLRSSNTSLISTDFLHTKLLGSCRDYQPRRILVTKWRRSAKNNQFDQSYGWSSDDGERTLDLSRATMSHRKAILGFPRGLNVKHAAYSFCRASAVFRSIPCTWEHDFSRSRDADCGLKHLEMRLRIERPRAAAKGCLLVTRDHRAIRYSLRLARGDALQGPDVKKLVYACM